MNRNAILKALLVSCLILGAQASLGAQLRLEFQGQAGGNLALTYDVNANVESPRTARLRHQGPAVNYFFTVDAGQNGGGNALARAALGPNGALLFYQVLSPGGQILTPTQGLGGSFPARANGFNQLTLNYTLVLLAGQFPPAGTYTDQISVELYEGTDASGILRETAVLNLSITMPQVLDLRLGSAGVSFGSGTQNLELSYGSLEPGLLRQAELLVRANVVFAVEFTSQNGGSLINSLTGVSLPYLLRLAGQTLSFAGTAPLRVLSTQSPTGLTGRAFALETETLNPGLLPDSGTYTDQISITILAN